MIENQPQIVKYLYILFVLSILIIIFNKTNKIK